MKYYSEILKKNFDTVEACNAAEKECQELQTKQTNEKKTLAKAVQDAEAKVDTAYKNIDAVTEKAKELSDKYLKELNEMLDPAKAALKEAQAERVNAIREFNNKFGVYTTHYTGDKAVDEFTRTTRMLNEFCKRFFF